MIKINFIHNSNYQFQELESVISDWDWYIKNNYGTDWLSLPKGIDRLKIKEYSKGELRKEVEGEYDENLYEKPKQSILENWQKISEKMEAVFGGKGIKFPNELDIYLTIYGTGGSYHLPNEIAINITKKFDIGLLITIVHEVIHLTIQEYIEKYGVNQQQKERIVDLFMSTYFSDIFPSQKNKTQPVYSKIDISKIDDIFEKNQPDMELVVKKVSEISNA